MASPFLMIRPFLAADEVPASRAIGVARPKAQGQAITIVDTNTKTAVDNAPIS